MMVGLTGGVGAGKSTVARLLAQRGAVIVDADALAREMVRPGTAGLRAVVERFGPAVLAVDGSLDRNRLASIVFADPQARADLEAIVHPLVGQRSAELMASAAPGTVVVYDVPLLAETGRTDFDVVVVVEAPLQTRLDRLAARGLPDKQARARMAVQASDDERRAIADEVLVNAGTRAELAAQVDALWTRLADRSAGQAGLEPDSAIR